MSGAAPTGFGSTSSSRRGGTATGLAVVVIGLFGLWRATLGANMSDDAHAVVLAVRLAEGGVPFRDEMNIQALGSLPAVPFTWLWLHAVGLTGLVLAFRVFFVVLAVAVGTVAYRALRVGLSRGVALSAAGAPLLAVPYDLLVTSYNTVPLLAIVLGTSAAWATVRSGRRRWAVVATVALAGGTTCYPPMVAAAVVLLVGMLLLARSGRLVVPVVAAGLAVSLPVLAWFLLVITPSAVQATLHYTTEFLAQGPSRSLRASAAATLYERNLPRARYLPLWALVLASVAPLVPVRLRAAAAAAIPVLAVAATLRGYHRPDDHFARAAAAYATVLCLALLPMAVRQAFARGAKDGGLGQLLGLGLAVALAQYPVILVTTSSGAERGIPFIALSGLLLAAVAALASLVDAAWTGRGGLAAGLAALTVALALSLSVFKDPLPWQLTTRISVGAFAGIDAASDEAATIMSQTAALEPVVHPDEPTLIYGSPGTYLLIRGTADTPVSWLVDQGPANRAVLDWVRRDPTPPQVVLVHVNQVVARKGWDRLAAHDPFIRWVRDHYTMAPDRAGPFYVFTSVA